MRRLSALDVASYILQRQHGLTGIELEKLVYYAQAWSLAWDGQPLFADEIQAWEHGPVVPRLYSKHAGQRLMSVIPGGDPARVTAVDRDKIDAVIDFYGGRDAAALRRLSHEEQPWRDARGSLPAGASSRAPIPHRAMRRFYTAQQVMGEGPRRPAAEVTEASLDEALEAAGHQMKKWRRTLDWLAVR
ncbi:Uncharacterized phage-associated protein [Blastococcus tunisiensis]|uniref:Uncharacterized phage-associated protein n=1 Tax=Blastococcus tunisiensis TaxID=1798228 RepID=A0A1I2HXW3_9ACTN|nr:Uncharacterized phage-associated protein [Blastococcus sp. DSM 46838]